MTQLMTAKQVAEWQQTSVQTVWNWARREEIPVVKIGGHMKNGRLVGYRLRFNKAAIEQQWAARDPWAAPTRGRRAS